MVFLKDVFFEKVDFEKKSAHDKKAWKFLRVQRVNTISILKDFKNAPPA